jgi:hypothetical protein
MRDIIRPLRCRNWPTYANQHRHYNASRPAVWSQTGHQPSAESHDVGSAHVVQSVPQKSNSRALLGLDDDEEPSGYQQRSRPNSRWQERKKDPSPQVRFITPRPIHRDPVQNFEAASRPTANRTNSRAPLGLDNDSSNPYFRQTPNHRHHRFERVRGTVQDENTLNSHLQRLKQSPTNNWIGVDEEQESGQQRTGQVGFKRAQYGSPTAIIDIQGLDPDITSQWSLLKGKGQGQQNKSGRATSNLPPISKPASNSDQRWADPFGDIGQKKPVTRGYKPLTDLLVNVTCAYCGEKGHTDSSCGQRIKDNGGKLSMSRMPTHVHQDRRIVAEQNLRALKAARENATALAPGQKLQPRIEETGDVDTLQSSQTQPTEPGQDRFRNMKSSSKQFASTNSSKLPANSLPSQETLASAARIQQSTLARGVPTDAAPSPKMVRWTPPRKETGDSYEAVQKHTYEREDRGPRDQRNVDRDLSKRSVFPAKGRRDAEEDELDVRPKRGRSRRDMDDDEDFARPPRRAKDKMRRRDQWARDEDVEEGVSRLDEARHRKKAKDRNKKRVAAQKLKPINLPEFISVSNLAHQLGTRYENFVDKMEELGFSDIGHDHVLTAENAGLIAMEYGFEPVAETIIEGTDIVS